MVIEISPYSKNAKKHPDKQLRQIANSIKRFGWQQPIKVGKNGIIIAGHGRWFAYDKFKDDMNLKEAWVIDEKGKTIMGEPEKKALSPQEEIAYRLADNKLNESDWDMNLVVPELKLLSDELLDLTGFEKDLVLEPEVNDDDVPDLPKKAESKIGDIYILGKHRVMCGDSTKTDDVLKLMNGYKADMVFTDPLYSVNYSGRDKNTKNTIKNDNMGESEFYEFLSDVFKCYKEAVKISAPFYVCHSSSSQIAFEKAMAETDLIVKNQIIWNKTIASMGWGDYRGKHEPIFYATYRKKKVNFYGDRSQYTVWDESWDIKKIKKQLEKIAKKQDKGGSTVWKISRDVDYKHPTQKPIELLEIAIKNSSKREDIILDLFLGSGSTLIGSEKTERICYGLELDPKYIDVIVQRYVDYTGNEEIIKNDKKIIWQKSQRKE